MTRLSQLPRTIDSGGTEGRGGTVGRSKGTDVDWIHAALVPLRLRAVREETDRGHRVTASGSAQAVAWQLLAEWDGASDGASGTVRLEAPGLACAPLDLARVQAGEAMPELTLSGWHGLSGVGLSDLGLLGRWLDRWRGQPRSPADPLAGLKLRVTPDGALDPGLLQRLSQWPGRPAFHLSVSPSQPLRLRAELWGDTAQLAFMLAWWQDLVPALLRSGLVQPRDPAGIRALSADEVEQLMSIARRQLGNRQR